MTVAAAADPFYHRLPAVANGWAIVPRLAVILDLQYILLSWFCHFISKAKRKYRRGQYLYLKGPHKCDCCCSKGKWLIANIRKKLNSHCIPTYIKILNKILKIKNTRENSPQQDGNKKGEKRKLSYTLGSKAKQYQICGIYWHRGRSYTLIYGEKSALGPLSIVHSQTYGCTNLRQSATATPDFSIYLYTPVYMWVFVFICVSYTQSAPRKFRLYVASTPSTAL